MSKPRILFSIPTRHHVEIALDELDGLQQLGYSCAQFPYAAKEGVTSKTGRMRVILQNAFRLISIARRFKPDVVYFNSRLEALAGTRDFMTISLLKTFYRKPFKVVLKSHGSDIDVFKSDNKLINKTVLPYLKKHIAGWLFLSSEEKEIISNAGYLDSDKLFVSKNIVRNTQFKRDENFRKEFNIPQDHRVLLFVGRLIPEKGIYEVINAFAVIKNDFKAKLLIVGWGPEQESLKELAAGLNITDEVIFTGFIPEAEVVRFYSNSDILVFPTYFPEGFPMSLFNSVSAGMPVVTTPIRAAADYLSQPENCLWVKPQNSESVSEALQKLLSSPELAEQMKTNNKLKGREFSREQVCNELSQIIDQITQS